MKKITILALLISLSFATSYEDWLKSQQNSFNNYKKSLDEEFSSMLKKDWEEFKTNYVKTPLSKPKPKTIPKIEEKIIPKKELILSKKVKPKIIKAIIKKPTIKVKLNKNNLIAKFSFFGQNILIDYDKNFIFDLNSIDKRSISNVWDKLSKTDTKSLLDKIDIYFKKYSLNDWGKYQLVYQLGYNIYKDKNRANLFSWYIFTKLGYDTKIGYNQNNIYLLSLVKQDLYQVSFFKLNNKKYYILTPNGRVSDIGNIYTYNSNYPKANKQFSFDMNNKAIGIYSNVVSKKLSFNYNGKRYDFVVKYSKDLIDFYKTFPQSEYRLYFHSKKSPLITDTLLLELSKTISGMNELEAVNFLLRFTQTAFEYEVDDEQFGYEKVLFPSETINYKYSDCEDRSIMFAYLVENLIGLDVVGLKFSDHLATAVNFSTTINGDSFKFKNKIFVVSDPTYINANVGMTMPKYKNSNFKIIE